MKKQLLSFVALLCVVWLTPTRALAWDFEVDGIYYTVTSSSYPRTVKVTNNGYYSGSYTGAITIPETVTYKYETYSVTSIGDYAFSSSSALTSIEIPANVTSIGDYAFFGCPGTCLTSIVVAAGNPNYDSRENCNALIETSSNTLLRGCNTTVIPNSVTSIAYHAFYGCSGLTSVEIPSSMTDIGDYAFYNCGGVTKVISRAIEPPTCRLYTWLGDEDEKCAVSTSTLYVPAGTKDAYAAAEGWKEFKVIEEYDATEITTLDAEATDTDLFDCEIYTAGGQRVYELQAGANIVRMKNGKVKKIVKR